MAKANNATQIHTRFAFARLLCIVINALSNLSRRGKLCFFNFDCVSLQSIKAPNATDSLLRRLLPEKHIRRVNFLRALLASGRNISVKYFNKRALFFPFSSALVFVSIYRNGWVSFLLPILMEGRVNLILSDFNHLLVFGKAGVFRFDLLLDGAIVFSDGRDLGRWISETREDFGQ